MANYDFLDAHSSVKTATSSTVGGAEFPVVKVDTLNNSSISGRVGASVIGHAPVVIIGGSVATATTNSSVMLLRGANNIGSVTTLQGTTPWITTNVGSIITVSKGSVITVFKDSSIITVSKDSSVLAVQSGAVRTSVISSAPSSMLVGASIFGQLPRGTATLGSIATLQGTNPWLTRVGGSIVTVSKDSSVFSFQKAGSVLAVAGGVTAPAGSVTAVGNSSVMLLRSPHNIGSVTTLQGTNPWIVAPNNSSMFAFQKAGSILAVSAASVSGVVGASVIGEPRVTVAPTTPSSMIEGIAVLTSTSVTTMVAAAGAGVKNYITDIWIANTGAADTLVTFSSGGGASILGYTIAPTLGGSNLPGLATPLRTLANQTFGIQAATATSTLYATVKGYKAA